jgi:hypothetical protein
LAKASRLLGLYDETMEPGIGQEGSDLVLDGPMASALPINT